MIRKYNESFQDDYKLTFIEINFFNLINSLIYMINKKKIE